MDGALHSKVAQVTQAIIERSRTSRGDYLLFHAVTWLMGSQHALRQIKIV